ncbi:hypothetical protein [Bartonella sp. OT172YNZD]
MDKKQLEKKHLLINALKELKTDKQEKDALNLTFYLSKDNSHNVREQTDL